jgi:hypothetical protein
MNTLFRLGARAAMSDADGSGIVVIVVIAVVVVIVIIRAALKK